MKDKNKMRFKNVTDLIGREIQIDTIESFLLYMDSSQEVTIKGCNEVVLCEETEICLKHDTETIVIKGTELRLQIYSYNETRIGGTIRCICFAAEEG